MRTGWLKQEGKPSCILFFAGWGMDPAPFQHIPVLEHDLLVIYDYNQLQTIDPHDLTNGRYDSLHLVTWSMGVWVAAAMIPHGNDSFASSTAINGTLAPIDDHNGIGLKTYDTMIDNFSAATLEAFYLSMFSRKNEAELFINNQPKRSHDDILNELVSLKRLYSLQGPARDCYNRKIVGSRDRIFSARNQTRSWGKGNCTLLKVPHFPFYTWPSWDFIVSSRANSV